VPAKVRGVASVMAGTFQNAGSMVSMAVFFTILTAGLASSLPGVMATDDAFVTLQESVDVPAEATIVGDAAKEVMVGVLLVLPASNVTISANAIVEVGSPNTFEYVPAEETIRSEVKRQAASAAS